MFKTTLKIEGMMCDMCEAHINDVIRKNFNVKKVSSSHIKGETVIISDCLLDMTALGKAVDGTGYKLISFTENPYEQKSKFHFFGKKA